MAVDPMMRFSQRSAFKTVPGRGTRKSYLVGKDPIDARINAVVTLTTRKCIRVVLKVLLLACESLFEQRLFFVVVRSFCVRSQIYE